MNHQKKRSNAHVSFLALCFGALLSAGACSKDEAGTSIIVEVWSDLEVPVQIDEVRISVVGQTPDLPFALGNDHSRGRHTFPIRVALVPGKSPDQSFTVVATGMQNARAVVSQTARLKFLPGDTRVLSLVLGRDCVGKECGNADSTCNRGACVSIDRNPRDLPLFKPLDDASPPISVDAISPPLTGDASPPMSVDASSPIEDAASVDSSEPDAGKMDVNNCSSRLDESCGPCGGKIRCDGTCSAIAPANLGESCGPCGGKFECDGACSAFPAQGCCKYKTSMEAQAFSRIDYLSKPYPSAANLHAMTWTWGSSGLGEGTYRAFLRFDLSAIPTNAPLSSARLRLFGDPATMGHSDPDTLNNDFRFHRPLANWQPSTLTWNMQPAVSADFVNVTGTKTPHLNYSVNVTSLIGPMITSPSENFGLRMSLAVEETYRAMIFASSAHANPALHPGLWLEFIPGACGF